MHIYYTFDYILKEQTEGYSKHKRNKLLRVKRGGNGVEVNRSWISWNRPCFVYLTLEL